jgi:aryl-alcohol dehydrogenase-like predicted oxidoreductase
MVREYTAFEEQLAVRTHHMHIDMVTGEFHSWHRAVWVTRDMRTCRLKCTPACVLPRPIQEFKKLQEEGKIRYVGVSNETPFGVMKFCEMAEKLDLPKIVSIQNCYSLINRSVMQPGQPKSYNLNPIP